MYVKDVLVQNQVGLHARPATFFIQKANEFKSSIWVEKEERRVNAKSLLGVLSLGIVGGTNIRIIADGADEESAVTAWSPWWNPASPNKPFPRIHPKACPSGRAFVDPLLKTKGEEDAAKLAASSRFFESRRSPRCFSSLGDGFPIVLCLNQRPPVP